MVICAGGCGRTLIPRVIWDCTTHDERVEEYGDVEMVRKHSADRCRTCHDKPLLPAPSGARGNKGRVVAAYERRGKPARDSDDFLAVADALGIQRPSLVRTLQRAGVLPKLDSSGSVVATSTTEEDS